MTDKKEIKIGSLVKLKNEKDWLKVTDLTVEKVKTIHKGELTFIRLYFGIEAHKPVWDYEVEEIKDDSSETSSS